MADFLLTLSLSDNNKHGNYVFDYDGPGKFNNDCIYYEDANYLILLDGVVFNKHRLMNDYAVKDWAEGMKTLYHQHGETFFELLKGSYYGAFFDKKKNRWILFTDHIGSKPLYYHKADTVIYFSNNYTKIVNQLKRDSIDISLDVNSAYLVLTYGYVIEEKTILQEVKRLLIGNYGKIEKSNFTQHTFYKISNDPQEISEREAINGIDERFRDAIQLAFEKDNEYELRHIVALSGGLDSRMTSWVAHEMGYTDQLNVTFSQSDYLDETIPKQIAAYLKHEWIFKALDNGLFLKSVDEITEMSGGNVLYYGLSHSNSLYKYINFKELGIIHSGQLGDVVIGTYSSKPSYHHSFSKIAGSFSTKLANRVQALSISDYGNEELHKMTIRGFYGMNMGLLPLQKHTETYSPFYDIDVMNFALRIPMKLRFRHKLYIKWIVEKYPKAADYIWESMGGRITDAHINYKGSKISVKKVPQKILSKIGFIKSPTETKSHMNPLSYWYNKNEGLKIFLDQYFAENIDRLDRYPQLKQDCNDLYKIGNGTEKNQVISLLSALKTHF